jgi:hypothetical protein
MGIRAEPVSVFMNYKSGKEIKIHLQDVYPRVGDAIICDKRKMYRVKDVVWDSYWNKQGRINTEVRFYLQLETKDAK